MSAVIAPLESPPTRAGLVEIRFDPDTDQTILATRRGRVVTVHRAFDEVEVYSLLDGEQLVVRDDPSGIGVRRGSEDAVFCGTDESAFATALTGRHIENLVTGGPVAFYDGLKPSIIRDLEFLLGPEAIDRQGDVWWAAVAARRREVADLRPGLPPLVWKPVTAHPILDTRHRVSGHLAPARIGLCVRGQWFRLRGHQRLVRGQLRQGPDHGARLLAPAIVARTPDLGLRRQYQNADGSIEELGD